MLCRTTVPPSRANRSNSVSSGLAVSRPEALSVKTQTRTGLQAGVLVLVQRAYTHVPNPLSRHLLPPTLNPSVRVPSPYHKEVKTGLEPGQVVP